MKRIHYNLAAAPRVNGRAFAAVVAALLLVLAALNAASAVSLSRLQRQRQLEKTEIRPVLRKMEAGRQRMQEQKRKIAAWKKARASELAFVNTLIRRKSFSFIARLDFLEKVMGPGLRLRSLHIDNDGKFRVSLTVSALAQNQLLSLYKKLLPFELAIGHENQSREGHSANLSFRMEDEKM
jgi:hypothetical protein